MIEVQTDETCYRLVDDDGNESAIAEYGTPVIMLSDDEFFYCLIGEPDEDAPQVFRSNGGTPVDSRLVEVKGLDDDEEEDDEEDDDGDDDPDGGGEEVGGKVERIA